jgi:Domain of unknown function (DUF5666)
MHFREALVELGNGSTLERLGLYWDRFFGDCGRPALSKDLRDLGHGFGWPIVAIAAAAWAAGTAAWAQASHLPGSYAAEGYVTAVDGPGGFVLNGDVHVTTGATTHYEWFNHNDIGRGDATADAVQIGAYVEVLGKKEKKSVITHMVRVQNEGERKIHGFGLVDKVVARGPEPVFRADGYLLRIGPNTATTFSGGLKTLDDVNPGVWVKYEGKRDKTGVVVASEAELVPGKAGKVANSKPSFQQAVLPGTNLIDSNGEFHSVRAKYRMDQMGGVCGWHVAPTDAGMQEKVARVGARLVPAFQRQMNDDERAKIHFRYYVVDEPRFRSDFGCATGVILVPRQLVDRLKNDDQLAAVLADGIAANLAWQSARLVAEYYSIVGIQLAGDVAGQFSPLAWLGPEEGAGVAMHEFELHLMRERARMALGLMADAGYDPWQAPEAWRLLDPKKLPSDPTTLKYPNRSGYQLAILAQQYKHDYGAATVPNTMTTSVPAAK